jgi:hypothetical protein
MRSVSGNWFSCSISGFLSRSRAPIIWRRVPRAAGPRPTTRPRIHRISRPCGVPPQLDDGSAQPQANAPKMDWKKLFDAAGLDPSRWSEAASREIPPFSFDERKAWTGTFVLAPNLPMRIEAAAWKRSDRVFLRCFWRFTWPRRPPCGTLLCAWRNATDNSRPLPYAPDGYREQPSPARRCPGDFRAPPFRYGP